MPATTRLLFALALAYAAFHVGARQLGPYELFHDELYYWAGALRPGLGYVDHPPLSAWVLAAGIALIGDGHWVFELVPALCGAATVVLTGLIARSLGAGRFGRLVAGLSAAVAPALLVMFSFYSVNAFEILFWTAGTLVIVERIRTGDERLWLAFGGVAGIALLNKHTFALLCVGLAVGVLATPLRAALRSRFLWLGAGLALLLALPNVYWNFVNGWPSWDFYQSRPSIDLPTTVAQALELQFLGVNPATVLVWVPGLLYLLLSHRMRAYRPLAIAFVALFVVIIFSGQRRGDRIVGIYPVVWAAGAAFWDQWRPRGYLALRSVLCALLLAVGALVVPATLPVLPPQSVAAYFEWIGEESPEIEAGDVGKSIPLYFMGRLEWERFADQVITTWESLPAEQRERSVVLAPHWVFTSVVEYYGRNRNLAPVVAPHNAYWFWREEAAGRDVVLSVGVADEVLERWFADSRRLAVFECEYCAVFRPDLPIHVSTGPVRPLPDLLTEWRHFSIQPAPALMREGLLSE